MFGNIENFSSLRIFLITIMENDPRLDANSIEREKPGIKLAYQYKDTYGRLYGSFESEELSPLPDPSSNEVTYFDGSVETPYGSFMLECKISEAKEALALIDDFIKAKEEMADLKRQLSEAENRLSFAQERYRNRGAEPDYEADHLVRDLQRRKFRLETKLKVHEEGLKKYKI